MATTTTLDVQVENHGSIFLFNLLTPEAQAWVEEHVSGETTYFHGALAVEHRYAGDLADGMIEHGLLVL